MRKAGFLLLSLALGCAPVGTRESDPTDAGLEATRQTESTTAEPVAQVEEQPAPVVEQPSEEEAAAPAEQEAAGHEGPAYRLEVSLPEGLSLEDCFATFPAPTFDQAVTHRMAAENAGFPGSEFLASLSNTQILEQRVFLKRGEPTWAQFTSVVHAVGWQPGDPLVWNLHVRSRDGLWAGAAPVTSLEGTYPGVVAVELTARGVIEGVVKNSDGDAVPTAWIQLYSPSDAGSPVFQLGADREGRFKVPWLEPGEYRVLVRTARYADHEASLVVAAGSVQQLDARLGVGATTGPISGTLRSRSGQHRSKGVIVSLWGEEGSTLFLFKSAYYRKRAGEYTATFGFDDVPSGTYELKIQPLDNLHWPTRSMIVSPPSEGLEFLCEDETPTFDLTIRAVDATTGEAIEQSWNILWQGDPLEDIRLDDHWETKIYEQVPEGVPYAWIVHAPGYRLARGDESAISAEGEPRTLTAQLSRGWGQVFKVTTRERKPLAGVELLADGEPAGTSDAQGMIPMDLDARPTRLEFVLEGWEVSWGSIDPGDARFGWGPETPVYMSPRDE